MKLDEEQLKVAHKVTDIAVELTLRSGSRWLVQPRDEYSTYWTLRDREGHEFTLHVGGYGNENRIRVSGNWPKYRSNHGQDVSVYPHDLGGLHDAARAEYKEITVALSKPAERIAADIRTRFWAGYFKVWNLCKDIAVRYEANGRRTLEVAQSLAEKFGDRSRVEPRGMSASFWSRDVSKVEVNVYDGEVSVNLGRLSSMSSAKAERVLKALQGA